MYQFKPATETDYVKICQLFKSKEELYLVYPSGAYPLTVKQVKELAEVRKDLTVVLDKNKVIGFANFYNYEPKQSVYIGNVVIEQAYRGEGLGKELVLYMIKIVAEKYQITNVKLSVFSDNSVALLLYAKLGFKPFKVEERKDTSGNRVALIHMQYEAPT